MSLPQILLPEILLVAAACVLFLLGFAGRRGNGRVAASVALAAVAGALVVAVLQYRDAEGLVVDAYQNFRVTGFGLFLRVIALSVCALLVLLSWPFGTNADGNAGVHYGRDGGEFFGLMLLAFAGLIMVPNANDLIVLFMAIELASIPTYILVAVSRPLAVAQEAGVKYFFLGAMAAAVMLMGFAYLYGTTGTTNLHEIANLWRQSGVVPFMPTAWQLMAGVLIVVGLSFKLAAVPMHAYVADVYQGAATPVTAILGFVPKATGMIALLKLLFVYAGGDLAWNIPPQLAKLVWIVAALTMTVGNLLAIMQSNVKRMLAYSSVAHSGYLLAGLAIALFVAADQRIAAIQAVLFYLAVYGIMSTATFGALLLIPSKQVIVTGDGKRAFFAPATTAETFDDLAGAARTCPVAAILLAIGTFSLVGLPLTGGFWGKYYLLVPAFSDGDAGGAAYWAITLAILLLVNSAISAAYYLRIIGTLFHRAEVDPADPEPSSRVPLAASVSVGVSCAAILFLGIIPATTDVLATHAKEAAMQIDQQGTAVPADVETAAR